MSLIFHVAIKCHLCIQEIFIVRRIYIESVYISGPLLRFPVVDVSVCLHDLRIRRGTSMAMVTSAVAQTILKALHNAHPILLEPMMAMQV